MRAALYMAFSGVALSAKSRWVNSTLLSTQYNMEREVIHLGITDYAATAAAPASARRELLCATFVLGAASSLMANIDNRDVACDWAIVVYDGDASLVCNPLRLKQSVVHCGLVPEAVYDGLGMYGQVRNGSTPTLLVVDKKTGKPRRPTIPKTILYTELLALLPKYKRVWLLDEDISLDGFDTSKFLRLWKCAFYPDKAPLIVQPLIAENTQYLRYVNARAWTKGGVIASGSGLVEQQCPAFDAVFFEWFLRRVLPLPRRVVLQNGVDWGHDRTWCNAARMYASEVLRWAGEQLFQACALLPGAPPVHHLNTRSMLSKRTQRERYRLGGRAVVQEYINLFPTWVLLDISRGPDPINKSEYKKVWQINPACREQKE
jgi:hypothetical protein